MKIAITGKGGTGKSTITALFAKHFRDIGDTVIVIDADPDMNLPTLFGIPASVVLTPVAECKELIAERTLTEKNQPSPFFKINPRVDDIPDTYCINHDGIKLMILGTIKEGGSGCNCPGNAFLKQLLLHITLARDETILLDMEAGIEHLGRGSTLGIDCMIIVVEPSLTSIETALRVKKLSEDIGIKEVKVIGNKISTTNEETFIREKITMLEILGFLDFSKEIKRLNFDHSSLLSIAGKPIEQIKKITRQLNSNGYKANYV